MAKVQHSVPGINTLDQVLADIRHALPVQGPIDTFIHHNTLHSFEDLPFEDAVEKAATIYSAEAYLQEHDYRELRQLGRIADQWVTLELQPHLGKDDLLFLGSISRPEFRRRLLLQGLTPETERTLEWCISEGRLQLRSDFPEKETFIEDAIDWLANHELDPSLSEQFFPTKGRTLDKLVADAGSEEHLVASVLWKLAQRAVRAESVKSRRPKHHEEILTALTGESPFGTIAHTLIQLCSAFTDQGISFFPLPRRESGFLVAAVSLLSQNAIPTSPWLRRTRALVREIHPIRIGAERTLELLLHRLGVEDIHAYLLQNALALKGWAGFMALLEEHPEKAKERPAPATLADYLAVQLLLLTAAIETISKTHNLGTHHLEDLFQLQNRCTPLKHQEASSIFEVVQLARIPLPHLASHGAVLAREIQRELENFPSLLRRRIWQRAYEQTFLTNSLIALKNHQPRSVDIAAKRVQVLFCIDEREESLRRHLEECDSSVETFGCLGFFHLPIAYKGIHNLHHEALCPVVMSPQIEVEESERSSPLPGNIFRRAIGYLNREFYHLTRSPLRGSFVTATLGHFALLPMALRVLAPALAGRFHELFHLPEVEHAQFHLHPPKAPDDDARVREIVLNGITVLFQTIGLRHLDTPLVVALGHGSSSLNNPHESAHDCGACSGHRGAPNARLFARFANDPEIRAQLLERGIQISPSTHILAGYHDTCDDSVEFFDEEFVPESHHEHLATLKRSFEEACARNATERSRRFRITYRNPKEALFSMRHRAEDFAEPRPEYGHATNALTFVGRRERTRGLFMDRRTFLASYDRSTDTDGMILERILSSYVPVSAGISLEYYFSYVDRTQYGCGTKLPHNIVGHIGVMDGTESDLRTGLPWQMVEIHEPVRMTFIVEAEPEFVARVLNRIPKIKGLLDRRWCALVAASPLENSFSRYESGEFHPIFLPASQLPIVPDSLSYCVGKDGPLPFVEVGSPPLRSGPEMTHTVSLRAENSA